MILATAFYILKVFLLLDLVCILQDMHVGLLEFIHTR